MTHLKVLRILMREAGFIQFIAPIQHPSKTPFIHSTVDGVVI